MKYLILIVFITSCSLLTKKVTQQYHYQDIKTFNGKDQSVPVQGSKASHLKDTSKASVAAWIYPTCTKCNHEIVAVSTANPDPTYSTGSRLALRTGKKGMLVLMARSIDEKTNAIVVVSKVEGAIKMNEWNHVAATVHYDENRVQMYVNAKEIATKSYKKIKFKRPSTPNTIPLNIVIGSEDDGKSNFFEGKIAHPLILDRSLSKKEIQELFKDKPIEESISPN